MKIGPKYKIAKRLGATVFEKTQTQKFALSEARSKKGRGRRPRNVSDFGKQLLEKQKVRMTYSLTERQFRNYINEAMETEGDPAVNLHTLLERRLDNVAYRMKLAPTRRAARQMVSHGHVTVNGKKITVPSHRTRPGDVISVRDGSKNTNLFTEAAARIAEANIPAWIAMTPKELKGEIKDLPNFVQTDTAGDLTSVISFYSR